MKCINFRIRTKNYQKYIYCMHFKRNIEISNCINCKYKEYKKIEAIKKQTKKQRKLERKRYSIITNNLNVCYICTQSPKNDLNEVFGGSNRKKSMQWGLVIPICRECHSEWHLNKQLRKKYQQEAQRSFEKQYGHEMFMLEFKRNYL